MPSYVTDANLSSYELAFCGGTAGVVSRAVIAPLDVVKIRMQLQTHRTHFGFHKHRYRNKLQKVSPSVDVKYSNITQALKTILKEEGIRGLYKGNMPAEYLYLSYSAVEFWAYKELEQSLEKLDKNQKLPNTLKTFGCGMIAGCAATAATYPFDLLRTRFAVRKDSVYNKSVTQAMIDIYHNEGSRGFYRGLWPAIIQIMPYMGLLFSSYDLFAKGFKKLRDENIVNSSYKPTHDMISGALSGFFSKMVVYPFDLVRKRLQMEGPSLSSSNTYRAEFVGSATTITTTTSTNWYTCLKNIIKQEGYKSLYKGLAPSLLKVAPANAVTFMVFEETKDFLVWLKKSKEL